MKRIKKDLSELVGKTIIRIDGHKPDCHLKILTSDGGEYDFHHEQTDWYALSEGKVHNIIGSQVIDIEYLNKKNCGLYGNRFMSGLQIETARGKFSIEYLFKNEVSNDCVCFEKIEYDFTELTKATWDALKCSGFEIEKVYDNNTALFRRKLPGMIFTVVTKDDMSIELHIVACYRRLHTIKYIKRYNAKYVIKSIPYWIRKEIIEFFNKFVRFEFFNEIPEFKNQEL